MFVLILLALVEITIGSTVMYIVGRILLPEIGLTAPGFWTWFWVSVFFAILGFFRGVLKEITS